MESSKKVKHYIVKETGDPEVDCTDVVDRGWGPLWIEFSKSFHDISSPGKYCIHTRAVIPASDSLPVLFPPRVRAAAPSVSKFVSSGCRTTSPAFKYQNIGPFHHMTIAILTHQQRTYQTFFPLGPSGQDRGRAPAPRHGGRRGKLGQERHLVRVRGLGDRALRGGHNLPRPGRFYNHLSGGPEQDLGRPGCLYSCGLPRVGCLPFNDSTRTTFCGIFFQ